MPLVNVPRSWAKMIGEICALMPRIGPILRPAVLFPEHAGIELSVEFREGRFRTGALERRADRQAGHRFGQRRVVGRRHGDRAHQRPRDGFRRERLNPRAELPHDLAVAERDADRFFEREVPHLVVVGVLERERRLSAIALRRATAR